MIFQVTDVQLFKQKALAWANEFDTVCYLDSNNFTDPYGKFDSLIAVGAKEEVTANAGNAFAQLGKFRERNSGFITGFFGYDLKNEVENLHSANPDQLQFPDLYFFAPEFTISFKGTTVDITGGNEAEVFETVDSIELPKDTDAQGIHLHARFSKTEYIDAVEKIQGHINRGDIYVTNFCQEFYAENADIAPLAIFNKLNI
ncbi:MAG: aminodeoxychorismate synthase component I, partial [Sphingobacteriales bacterium]